MLRLNKDTKILGIGQSDMEAWSWARTDASTFGREVRNLLFVIVSSVRGVIIWIWTGVIEGQDFLHVNVRHDP